MEENIISINRIEGRALMDSIYNSKEEITKRVKKIRTLKSWKNKTNSNFNFNSDFQTLKIEIKSLYHEYKQLKSIAGKLEFKTTSGIYADDGFTTFFINEEMEMV